MATGKTNKMHPNKKCVFCKITQKKDPNTEILYECSDGEANGLVVFKDIKPAAPHHYLVIPKEHIKDSKALQHHHVELVEKMIAVGKQVLREQGGNDADVRLGFHWPPFTMITHLHLHVISPPEQLGYLSGLIFRANSWWFVTADWMLDRLKKLPPESH